MVRIYIIFASFVLVSAQEANDDLIAVSVIFRHGQRTPRLFYPKDPYQNASFWPVLPGELTNEGKVSQKNLGVWLRNRYGNFLSPKYSPKDVYIRSADKNRCLESAAAVLSGLFPPQGDQIWDTKIPWLPIPIHTVPIENDGVIELKKPCPKYQNLLKKIVNTGFYKELNDVTKELYAYLSENTGQKIDSLEDIKNLHDTLFVESEKNYTLPNWTSIVYPEPLRTLSSHRFKYATSTRESTRFSIGQLFDKILKQFGSFDEFSPKKLQKFMLYSAHDDNLFNTMSALKTSNKNLIPYSAAVIFELRQSITGRKYVKMLYKTNSVEVLSMNGCETNCAYSDFLRTMRPLAINDAEWDEACQVSPIERIEDVLSGIIQAYSIF